MKLKILIINNKFPSYMKFRNCTWISSTERKFRITQVVIATDGDPESSLLQRRFTELDERVSYFHFMASRALKQIIAHSKVIEMFKYWSKCPKFKWESFLMLLYNWLKLEPVINPVEPCDSTNPFVFDLPLLVGKHLPIMFVSCCVLWY